VLLYVVVTSSGAIEGATALGVMVVVRTYDALAKTVARRRSRFTHQDASLRGVLGDRQGAVIATSRLGNDGRRGGIRGTGRDGAEDGGSRGAGLTLRSGGDGRVIVHIDGRNVVVDGRSLRISRVNGGSREVLGDGRRGRELDGLGDHSRLLGAVTQGVGDGDVVGGSTGVGDSADDGEDSRNTGTGSHGSRDGVVVSVVSVGTLDPAGTREFVAVSARGHGNDEGGNDAEQLEGHHLDAGWFS
jgi:hypothetical protein